VCGFGGWRVGRLDDEGAVDHVHAAGESERSSAGRVKADGGAGEGRQGGGDSQIREHHPGGAVADFLPVEHDLQGNALTHPDHVGAVPASDFHLDPSHPAGQLRGGGPARAEEEPAQPCHGRDGGECDDNVGGGHGQPLSTVLTPNRLAGYPYRVGTFGPRRHDLGPYPHPVAAGSVKGVPSGKGNAMKRQQLPLYSIAAAILVVGLVALGVPASTLLFGALVLACPLMMLVMMGGMHGSHVPAGHDAASHDADRDTEDAADGHDPRGGHPSTHRR